MVAPPLYVCELCKFEIDPKGHNTIRLATTWVRGQSKTLFSVEQEHYRYRHDFCVDKEIRDQQEALF